MQNTKRSLIKFFFLSSTALPVFNLLGILGSDNSKPDKDLPAIKQIGKDCFLIDGWVLTRNDLNI